MPIFGDAYIHLTPATKSGVGEEVGTADRPGTSSPRGLEFTEAHLSVIADKVIKRLTAGKAAANGQGEEVIGLVSRPHPQGWGLPDMQVRGKPQWVAQPAYTGQA